MGTFEDLYRQHVQAVFRFALSAPEAQMSSVSACNPLVTLSCALLLAPTFGQAQSPADPELAEAAAAAAAEDRHNQSLYPQSREQAARALAIYERLQDNRGIGRARHLLGQVAHTMPERTSNRHHSIRSCGPPPRPRRLYPRLSPGLALRADLVVLSACRSGSGLVNGDGIATFALIGEPE